MSKSTLSARHTTRLILSYRRAARLARETTSGRERLRAERTCGAIASQLADGGRPDIASDLFAETLTLA